MAAPNPTLLSGSPSSLTLDLHTGDPEAKREAIRDYFHETWNLYERLFEPLKGPEAFTTRADPLRHPLIFYYGHTAVFFINKLVLGKFLKNRIDPELERQCAIGVDEMSWDDLNEKHYEWPSPESVKAYRDQARTAIDELISSAPLELPIGWDSPFWVIMMGIEHERIHLETSSVLIRQLPLNLLQPEHPAWPVFPEDAQPPENTLLEVPGGDVTLGRRDDSPFYGWDNEYGRVETATSTFNASKYLVSNHEYLAFINDGGYREPRFWTEEGWNWAQYDARGMPRFWRKCDDGTYKLRVMLKEILMPWSWPVEVNYLEAKAFCNWLAEKTGKPIRLPTEAEWNRLADVAETGDVDQWQSAPGNANLQIAASSVPVTHCPFGAGFYDVIGNAWQHSETPIAGFPGFNVHPLYDDFSTPTFDMKHNLIMGGSWISTGNELLRSSRYAFRRHFYQHAGFRYVETDADVVIPDDRYETDPDVTPWCELHYGPTNGDGAGESYAERIAQLCLDRMAKRNRGRALEIGCKTGRTAFELAAGFDEVVGLDPTARQLRIGVEMAEKGYTQWEIPKEGDLVDFRQAHLKDLGLDRSRNKVDFQQADLANMKALHCGFDLILVNGLLERSYAPAGFLRTVHERLNDGGLLVIACSNDWRESVTARENWLGGFKETNGENLTTLDALHRALDPHFSRTEAPVTLDRLLRQNARVFELAKMEISVWAKR